MKKLSVCIILFLGVVVFYSCEDDDLQVITNANQMRCDSISPTYTVYIEPIMDEYCATPACHGDGGANGIYLRNYEEVKSAAQTGQFIKAIKHDKGATWMPYRLPKLFDHQIEWLECWIQNGYEE